MRANPFGDLGDFASKKEPQKKPVEKQQIEQLAQENGFPSRSAAEPKQNIPVAARPLERRRYTTGRNQQLNIKAKAETIALFYKLADQERVPLGELLERALASYDRVQSAS